jgi:hypothetical protein
MSCHVIGTWIQNRTHTHTVVEQILVDLDFPILSFCFATLLYRCFPVSTMSNQIFVVKFHDGNNECYEYGPYLRSTQEDVDALICEWCMHIIQQEARKMLFETLPENVRAVLTSYDFVNEKFTFVKDCDRSSLLDAVDELDEHGCWHVDEDRVTVNAAVDFTS